MVEAIVALVGGVIVATIGVLAGRSAEARRQEFERQVAQEKRGEVVDRYRQPLASAAFDLESRLLNILEDDFLEIYAGPGSDRREMALKSTTFRLVQYFAWAELLRERVQLLKFPDDQATRSVERDVADVRRILNTDKLGALMIWRDEQRALGALLIDRTGDAPRVAGFAEYLAEYERFRSWCDPIEQTLLADRTAYAERIQLAQHALCDLVRELDPEELQYERDQIKYAAAPLPREEAEKRREALLRRSRQPVA